LGRAQEGFAPRPGLAKNLVAFVNLFASAKFVAFPIAFRVLSRGAGAGMLGEAGKHAYDAGLQLPAQRVVRGLQFETDERIVEVGHATAVERIAKTVPRVLRRRAQLAPIEKHVTLVGVEVESEAAVQ
jgi:hypothetical protein